MGSILDRWERYSASGEIQTNQREQQERNQANERFTKLEMKED